MRRILTGDRPTGPLHLGHYVGSLKSRLEFQENSEVFILIADIQALTDNFENPGKVSKNILGVAIDYLSIGLDPKKAVFVVQSQVPEIAELTVLFMNLVSVGRLGQNPTVKTEIKEKGLDKSLPVGFLAYPVSQAADIAIFGANIVPVGQDQLPMIEQTREIVRRFNKLYGKTLIEPKAELAKFPRIPGIDGKNKMSKSLNNAIYLSDSEDIVREKVRKMYTDPKRIRSTDLGRVKDNPVFIYHDAFNRNLREVKDLKARYKKGKVGDVEVKEKLARAINDFLEPIRERREYFSRDKKKVLKILEIGTRKGRKEAAKTLLAVKRAMKINYW